MNLKITLISLISLIFINTSYCQTNVGRKVNNKKLSSMTIAVQKRLDSIQKTKLEKENVEKNSITGNAIFMNKYSGGAWPSKEILDQYQTEYPLSNTTILLKNITGKSSSIKITTDSKGRFKTKLDPGTYKFYMTKFYNRKMGADFDSDNSDQLNKCFGQITITENQKNAYIIFFQFGSYGMNNRP